MAGLLDWFSPQQQPSTGLLGGMPPQGGNKIADILSILGATLQDYNTANHGGQGAALLGLQQKMQRLKDQNNYQQSLSSLFAPGSTMQMPGAQIKGGPSIAPSNV